MASADFIYRSLRSVIAEQARRYRRKPYMYAIDQDKTLSYEALHRLANRAAHFFKSQGLKANDRVLLLSENSIEFIAMFLAVQRFGATIATANVEMNRANLKEIVAAIKPKLVIYQEGMGFKDLCAGAGVQLIPLGVWWEEGGSTGFFGALDGQPDDDIPEVCGPDDIAVIFYTSGTEAKPKGVLQTHASVCANFDATADCVGLREDDRMLDCRSYTWLSAQNMSLGGPLTRGATVYMAQRFSRTRYFEWISAFDINIGIAVPTILNIFIAEPVRVHGSSLPHLRFMMTSSAPMLPEQWRRFEQMYGIRVCQSYGCSEGGLMCGHRGIERKIGTVGLPLKYQNLRVLDPVGTEVPVGQPGELVVSGPQRSYGYLHADGSVQVLPSDGHRTGDLVVRDEDGHIRIVGRLKDLIIRGGVNISPIEIDGVLSLHPDILEGAAVGVPDPIYGEEVVAFVVPRANSTLSADDVIAHCSRTLASFKTPKEVAFIDALPKNERGKLDRESLASRWKQQQARN
jgi:acyl-coenzyme A synthetase/AMP-(fatty) acid ligase